LTGVLGLPRSWRPRAYRRRGPGALGRKQPTTGRGNPRALYDGLRGSAEWGQRQSRNRLFSGAGRPWACCRRGAGRVRGLRPWRRGQLAVAAATHGPCPGEAGPAGRHRASPELGPGHQVDVAGGSLRDQEHALAAAVEAAPDRQSAGAPDHRRQQPQVLGRLGLEPSPDQLVARALRAGTARGLDDR
jgi:hypothetical protein